VTLTTSPIPKRISLGPRRSVKTLAILVELRSRTAPTWGVTATRAYGRLSGFLWPARTYELSGPAVGIVEQPPFRTVADMAAARATCANARIAPVQAPDGRIWTRRRYCRTTAYGLARRRF